MPLLLCKTIFHYSCGRVTPRNIRSPLRLFREPFRKLLKNKSRSKRINKAHRRPILFIICHASIVWSRTHCKIYLINALHKLIFVLLKVWLLAYIVSSCSREMNKQVIMAFCAECYEMAICVVILLLLFLVCFHLFWFLTSQRSRNLSWSRMWLICSRRPHTAGSILIQEDEGVIGKQKYSVESKWVYVPCVLSSHLSRLLLQKNYVWLNY